MKINMEPKEVYKQGTVQSIPTREIDSLKEAVRPNNTDPDGFVRDVETLRSDLRWYKDEVANLEIDISQLGIILYGKDQEIAALEDEIEVLQGELESLRAAYEHD